jgi:protein-disulfide isomerase
VENVSETPPAADEVGDDYSPIDEPKETFGYHADADVFVIPRTTFNYIVIAATFLVVGIILGAILFGARGGGLDRAELATLVENAVAAALNNDTVQGLDQNKTYEVSFDDEDPSTGPKDAKVVVIEFSDFRCPYCGRFAAETLPTILKEYGDQILYVYRDYPQFGALSVKAALAAECADDQEQFWMMHNLLLANRPLLESETIDSAINEFATQIGLDMESFNRCMETEAHLEEITIDFRDGQKYGPIGTPTFFVNGKPIIGAQSYLVFADAIDKALAAAESAG